MLNWAVPWRGDIAHLIEQPYEASAPALCGAAPPPAPFLGGAPRQWWMPSSRIRVACVYCKLEAEGRHLVLPAWTFSQAEPLVAPSSPGQLRPAHLAAPAFDPDARRVCDGDPAPLLVRVHLPNLIGGGTTTDVTLGPRDIVRSPFDRQPQPDETVAIGHWEAGTFSTYWEGPLTQLTWRYVDVTHGEHVWHYLSGWDGPIRCSQCGLGRLAARGDRVPCPLCYSRHPVGQPVSQHGRWRGVQYHGAPFHWPGGRVTVLRLGHPAWRDAVRCRTNEVHEFTASPVYDYETNRYLRDCSRCGIILALDAEAASWNPEPLPDIRLVPCPACGAIHTLAEGHREFVVENMPTLTPEQMGDIILTPEQLRELSVTSGWVRDSEATAMRIQAEQFNRRALVEELVEQWCQEIPNAGVQRSLRELVPAIVQFISDNPGHSSAQELRSYFVPPRYAYVQQDPTQSVDPSPFSYITTAATLIERWCSEVADESVRIHLRATPDRLARYLANHPDMSESTIRENWVGPMLRAAALNRLYEIPAPAPTTPLCACGCGQHVKKAQSRFCAGHNTAGYHAQRRRERVS